MADPRAFISFDFDHDERAGDYSSARGRKIHRLRSRRRLVLEGHPAAKDWEETIAVKVGACNMVIVLVGNTMASATGVAKEIAMAKGMKVPLRRLRNGAGPPTLPTGSRAAATSPGDGVIAAMIEQAMGEGKNA